MERLAAEIAFYRSDARATQALMPLPDWEILPYDLFSPHPDIISRRLQTLFELPDARGGCLILAADTLLQRLPPVAYVRGRALRFEASARPSASSHFASAWRMPAMPASGR